MSANEHITEWLTPNEVAAQCRVNVATVRRWAQTGRIDTIRLPSGRQRIPDNALLAHQRRGAMSPVRSERGA